jgi:nucleotide-binding universal stress UspA family protein
MTNETWLVAYDFSDCGDLAINETARMLEKLGGKMVMLHVHPMLQRRPEMVWGEEMDNVEALRMKMQDLARELHRRFPRVDIDVEVVFAEDPAQCIVEEAKRRGADHVVVGTHSKKGVQHFVLGSVAERVARDAPMPVTIVRGYSNTDASMVSSSANVS